MDVVILLAFTAIFGGWLFWLAGRKPSDHGKENKPPCPEGRNGSG